jgi:signal transduction histidine kinase
MPMNRRSWFVYALLGATWAAICVWQTAEHIRFRKSTHAGLVNRGRDISDTVALVMRSQRRFGGVISRERMEGALKELIKPDELTGVALLNVAGDIVASAGDPPDLHTIPRGSERKAVWESARVTLLNVVDLGTNVTQEAERPNRTIVIPRVMFPNDTNRPPPPPGDSTAPRPPERRSRGTNEASGRRPFWMSEAEFETVRERQGVHSFALTMSTIPLRAATRQDLWLRCIIGVLTTISVAGTGVAWRTLRKTSDLQIRLVRASELNTHFRAMNLAAAGLAHETRNPLNIIRGMAQMITKEPDASTDVREIAGEIVEQADRVNAQLNEFINYARPREVRQTAVSLQSVANEVTRALAYDAEEKNLSIEVNAPALVINADEQLLRQALFNLVLNAVQAVPAGGSIQIIGERVDGENVTLEIHDNGPGIAPEHRTQIFKPYFTTNQKGTGLGLAIVQQIVLSHGWEIQCLSNSPQGAIFRISHMKVAAKS